MNHLATPALILRARRASPGPYLALGTLVVLLVARVKWDRIFAGDTDRHHEDYPWHRSVPIRVLISFLPGGPTPVQALIGGAVGFSVFLLLALISRGAMGLGDVKLAGVIGLMTGYPLVVAALGARHRAGRRRGHRLLLVTRPRPAARGRWRMRRTWRWGRSVGAAGLRRHWSGAGTGDRGSGDRGQGTGDRGQETGHRCTQRDAWDAFLHTAARPGILETEKTQEDDRVADDVRTGAHGGARLRPEQKAVLVKTLQVTPSPSVDPTRAQLIAELEALRAAGALST